MNLKCLLGHKWKLSAQEKHSAPGQYSTWVHWGYNHYVCLRCLKTMIQGYGNPDLRVSPCVCYTCVYN